MNLPDNAIIIDTFIYTEGNSSFAFIRFKIPEQGGYDRPKHDDMFKNFHGTDSKEKATQWIQSKKDSIGKKE